MASRVFISYRREDSKYQARLIFAALQRALPRNDVFMDVDSIPPGSDFVEILKSWVNQCGIMLALIGPGWLNAIDEKTGQRRLDNPNDFVRIEIREALMRGIPVVPVLLDATPMPDADKLPTDMAKLTVRQAMFVDYRTFDVDVEHLIRKIGLQSVLPSAFSPAEGKTTTAEIASRNDRYREIAEGVSRGDPGSVGAAVHLVLEFQRTGDYGAGAEIIAELAATYPENEQANFVLSILRDLPAHEQHVIPLIMRAVSGKISKAAADELSEKVLEYAYHTVQQPYSKTNIPIASDVSHDKDVDKIIAQIAKIESYQTFKRICDLLQEQLPGFSGSQQERIVRHIQALPCSTGWWGMATLGWLKQNVSPIVRERILNK